jgi:carbamoyltransferase
MGSDLDKLAIENYYLDKKVQNRSLKKDYTKEFELD